MDSLIWYTGIEGYDRIPNLVDGCQDSGILTFSNILVKFCIYPYIVNHVIWIALFGIQESRGTTGFRISLMAAKILES